MTETNPGAARNADASPPPRRASFAARLRRLNRVYWRSASGKKGLALLAGAVSLELGVVWLNVGLAGAQREVFDAIQVKDSDGFFAGAGHFFGLTLFFVLASAYRVYLRQCLEIDWRRTVTADYVGRWIAPAAYRQREVDPDATDNPDQRIAEDVRNYVSSTLGLGLSLLAAVATLVSFSGLLWSLSADWPLAIGEHSIRIPGLMLWVAFFYALFAMALTHLVGRPLVPINFDRQRVEADFRYSLVRFRENVEAVALARGAGFEQRGALERFGGVMQNWFQLIRAQRRLTLLTTTLGQTNAVLPLLIAAPAYFSGWLTLGSVVQTRTAYAQVSGALAWFMFAYQEIAAWRASIERLSSFSEAVDSTEADLARTDRIQKTVSGDDAMHIEDLRLDAPDGRVIVDRVTATIPAGSRVCVIGVAGAGKTMLFRALAGIWPFGGGRVAMPAGATAIFLPQRPYLPMGTLRDVATYPEASGRFADDRIRDALEGVGLEHLAGRLDEEAAWDELLSGDEEQRLSLARVFLQEPDWIFLDDATAALEEAREARIYEELSRRLPRSTVVTMTRRPAMARLHREVWTLEAAAEGPAVLVTG